MIEFDGDERFADVEYIGVQFDASLRVLVLRVSSDPADNCDTIVLHDVATFDVVHFMPQNVVHYLDVARLAATDLKGFCELARKEGASVAFTSDPRWDFPALGLIFVSANGATIFALGQSVEKRSSDGRSIYSVRT